MKRKLTALILGIALAFSLTACGGTDITEIMQARNQGDNGNTNSSDNGGQVGDGGNSYNGSDNGSSSSNNAITNKVTPLICRIGDDLLCVAFEGDQAKRLMSRNGSDSSYCMQLYLYADKDKTNQRGTIDGRSYGGGFSYTADGVDYGYFQNSYDGQDITALDNFYMVKIPGDGINGYIPDDYYFDMLIVDDSGSWDFNKCIVASGKIGDYSKDLTEDDLKAIVLEKQKNFVPENSAHDCWNGIYLSDSYDSKYGAIIKVNDAGAIEVNFIHDGETGNYVLEENMYDEANYDYGDVIKATAGVDEWGKDKLYLEYSKESSYEYVSLTYYDDNSESHYASLYTVGGNGNNPAPAGFENKDTKGNITEILNANLPYFHTNGDDFYINYHFESYAYTYKNGEEDKYACSRAELYEFDVNGICNHYAFLYSFGTESDAKAYYDYIKDNAYYDYEEYSINGLDVSYNWNSIYSSYTKSSISSWESFYDGANYYYYDDKEPDFDYSYYVYMSKPSENTKTVSKAEDIIYWFNMPHGSHNGIDSPDTSLYTSFDTYYGGKVNFSADGDDLEYGDGEYRFDGRNGVSLYYDTWDGYVIVKEYEFGDKECTVTQYKYTCDDFMNVPITFDNYKSATPFSTTSHRFDLTRVR